MFLKFLASLLVATACWAQQAAPPKPLTIKVIAGEGATNNVSLRMSATPAVEVLDEAGKPVQGAQVTFETPRTGPTVTFFGEMHKNTIATDAYGHARIPNTIPNEELGKFRIVVRAVTPTAYGETTINQTNAPSPNASVGSKHKKTVLAVIGAAALIGIGVAVASKGDSNGTTAAAAAKRPVTIGAGPITIGAPR